MSHISLDICGGAETTTVTAVAEVRSKSDELGEIFSESAPSSAPCHGGAELQPPQRMQQYCWTLQEQQSACLWLKCLQCGASSSSSWLPETAVSHQQLAVLLMGLPSRRPHPGNQWSQLHQKHHYQSQCLGADELGLLMLQEEMQHSMKLLMQVQTWAWAQVTLYQTVVEEYLM